MREFTFWMNTQGFGADADQSALLNRASDLKSISFRMMCVFMVLVAVGLTVVTLPMLLVGNWDLGLLFLLLLATVIGLLTWALTGWSVRAEIKAGRKQRKLNGVFDRQITIRLSDEGCFVTVEPNGKPSLVFTWEDVGKISESEDLFFLAGKKVPGICLRKDALTEGTEEMLRSYLQSKYNKPIQRYEIKLEKLQKLLKE